jgi:hypothetical protein
MMYFSLLSIQTFTVQRFMFAVKNIIQNILSKIYYDK